MDEEIEQEALKLTQAAQLLAQSIADQICGSTVMTIKASLAILLESLERNVNINLTELMELVDVQREDIDNGPDDIKHKGYARFATLQKKPTGLN